jgi:DNA (cytosine-5)-methyltransferase 1
MFSAQEVGAPHRRNRVFIAAVANGDSGRLEGFSKRNDQDGSDAQGLNPDRCNKDLADTMHKGPHADCSSRQVDQKGWSPQNGHTSSSCEVQRHIQQGGLEETSQREGSTGFLADTNSSRSWKDQQQTELRSDRSVKSPINSRQTDQTEAEQIQRWPTRPGQKQHYWEKPRTIEPRMGGTVDGNTSGVDMPKFRVDRLRLLGNGVVPATAEVAFRTLFTQLREDTH